MFKDHSGSNVYIIGLCIYVQRWCICAKCYRQGFSIIKTHKLGNALCWTKMENIFQWRQIDATLH